MIELFRRSRRFDVLGVEPDFFARSEGFGNRRTMSIGRSLSLGLSDGQLFSTIIVKFGERTREVVCVRISN